MLTTAAWPDASKIHEPSPRTATGYGFRRFLEKSGVAWVAVRIIRIVAEGAEGTIGPRLAGCRVGRSACDLPHGCGTLSRVRRNGLESALIPAIHSGFLLVDRFGSRPFIRTDRSAARSARRRSARRTIAHFSRETSVAGEGWSAHAGLSEVDSRRTLTGRANCQFGWSENHRRRQGHFMAAG